jgi:NDP-sugar pyrophosphorylase family protein
VSVSPAPGPCLASIDVLVLAGGLGTRLAAVLPDRPKLLAPVAGRPYLGYLLDWLARFGAHRIVLGLSHRADAVLAHLAAHPRPDLEIVPLIEPRPLGTAGAVRFARATLKTDPVLVVNGDSFTDADLCAFLRRHDAAGAPATILCTEVDDAGRFGRVVIDRNGRIERFVEKDARAKGVAPINAGVYLFSARLLDQIAAGAAVSLERDVFERLAPGTLAAFAGRFGFVDIGTPESLARAAELLSQPAA